MIEVKAACWTFALCAGLIAWLYVDVQSMKINYDWHNHLINSSTGEKIKPSDVIDLSKIIKQPESYINATNSIERLYDLEYQTNLENPFALDQVYTYKQQLELSGWPVANQTSCARDLDWIRAQLAAHKEYALVRGRLGYELTQLMDSYGKPEAGLYSGVVTWHGSYKQCKRLSLNGGAIKTRYCLARMRPTWWPTREAANPKTRLRLGICLPETCDTQSFEGQKQKIDSLIKFDMNKFLADNLEFDSMFCLPDERSPIRQLPDSGRTYLLVLGIWLACVVVASALYELIRRRQRFLIKTLNEMREQRQHEMKIATLGTLLSQGVGSEFRLGDMDKRELSLESKLSMLSPAESFSFKFLEALSIHNSLKSFKSNAFLQQQQQKQQQQLQEKGSSPIAPSPPPPGARVNLGALSAVKFLMAITVVLAHSSYLTSIYARSLTHRVDINTELGGRMILSVSKAVDTFFVFFGLLTAYTLLRKFSVSQLSRPLVWFGINLGILLRITPVFMLVYWFSRSISPFVGDGPWWDYGVFRYSMKGNCMHEPWWKSIPYFGCSGSPPVASCVLPSWFLVSYAQLSLLMPLITYLMCKLPGQVTKFALLFFVSIISGLQLALKMYRQTSFKAEALSLYGGFLADMLEKFESTGTMATLGRVGCVSVGCYVGYLLNAYEKGKIQEWPGWLRSKMTLLVVCLMHLLIVFLPLISQRLEGNDHVTTMNEFVSSYVVIMILWPVLNAILVIISVTIVHKTAIIRFFSHSFWHSANKLGLCIYLVHWEVIFLGITSFEQAPSMGFLTDIFKMWSFGVFFSIILAFVIHILIEAPLSALLMTIARKVQENHLMTSSTQEDNLNKLTKQDSCRK